MEISRFNVYNVDQWVDNNNYRKRLFWKNIDISDWDGQWQRVALLRINHFSRIFNLLRYPIHRKPFFEKPSRPSSFIIFMNFPNHIKAINFRGILMSCCWVFTISLLLQFHVVPCLVVGVVHVMETGEYFQWPRTQFYLNYATSHH